MSKSEVPNRVLIPEILLLYCNNFYVGTSTKPCRKCLFCPLLKAQLLKSIFSEWCLEKQACMRRTGSMTRQCRHPPCHVFLQCMTDSMHDWNVVLHKLLWNSLQNEVHDSQRAWLKCGVAQASVTWRVPTQWHHQTHFPGKCLFLKARFCKDAFNNCAVEGG